MFKKLMQGNPLTPKAALRLSAPHTWPPSSILPSVFAALLCRYRGYTITWGLGLVLVVICILMQGSVNTLNDFFDFIKGNDSEHDFLEPSDSVLVFDKVAPLWAGLWGLAQLGMAGLIGLFVVYRSGPAPLLVGMAGAAVVAAYSAGPLPLSYLPVGELVSGFVMGGLIPLGVFAACTGRIVIDVLLWALPFVLGIGLMMLVNNTSDIEKDAASGRRTLPVIAGRQKAAGIYRSVLLLWLLAAAGLAVLQFGAGAAAVPVFWILGRKRLVTAFRAELLPENRISNMKGILTVNLTVNGGYLAALIVVLLLKEAGV